MSWTFISYARVDAPFASELRTALTERGGTVWLDLDRISGNDDWLAQIDEAVGRAGAVVFVMSNDSLRSEICLHELRVAGTHGKRILALVRTATPDLPVELAAAEHVAVGAEEDMASVADRVTAVLAVS